MVFGIGTDIVDCRRILKTLRCFDERFIERIFLPQEIAHIERRMESIRASKDTTFAEEHQARLYAKNFAAKEAMLKALGTGRAQGVSWKHMEIKRLPSGQPYISLTDQAWERAAALVPKTMKPKVLLSLSDEPPYALAFVMITGIQE